MLNCNDKLLFEMILDEIPIFQTVSYSIDVVDKPVCNIVLKSSADLIFTHSSLFVPMKLDTNHPNT